ncbi:dimethylsulfoniopropionate lyase [Shinella sp. CPCC 101442]|nr:dimethylsulfoniopropionate lyase [Shinella sp. CPCC 101442]MCR6498354.1 dimethylsulfoniopropionate lyase [Shinella sp. CPCC 101442]
MARDAALQGFLDAAIAAFGRVSPGQEARRSVDRITILLDAPQPARRDIGKRLPVCDHLEEALSNGANEPALAVLLYRFRAIEPRLEWTVRSNNDGSASENFAAGHANALIVGPGGLEDRRDVWFGASLLAPHVRYPDHDHPPEETYLVLSEGEFMHGDSGWFSPGIGGSFYNTPGIRHAMRSVDKPLFAFWALLPEH